MSGRQAVSCAVRTCGNNFDQTGRKVNYFSFPTDEETSVLWKIKCDRADAWDVSNAFICSSHFTKDDYETLTPGIKRLHPLAIPSRNLGFEWDRDVVPDGGATPLHTVENVEIITDMDAAEYFSLDTVALHQEVVSSSFHPDATIVYDNQGLISEIEPNAVVEHQESAIEAEEVDVTPKSHKYSFCIVPTCSARITSNAHLMPKKDVHMRKIWVKKIFFEDLKISRIRYICRRHFTTADYSEKACRLITGAIPSQNLPRCKAEALLARKKLALDLKYRKEEKLSFEELLARHPDLVDLYSQFVVEMRLVDPLSAEIAPVLHRRGELQGAGEPVNIGTPFVKTKIRPGPKQKVKPAKLTPSEIAEMRAHKKLNKLVVKSAMKKQRLLLRRQKRKELRMKFMAQGGLDNPESQNTPSVSTTEEIPSVKSLSENSTLSFSDKIQIITEDPEKKTKYKVIVKKLVTNDEEKTASADLLAKDKPKAIALANKVIKKINFSNANRVKFIAVENVIKRESAKSGQQIGQTPSGSDGPHDKRFDDIDDAGPAHSDDGDHFDDPSDNEPEPEESIEPVNMEGVESVPLPETEDFDELANKLRCLSEDEARAIVKEKMDAYKETFKNQVSQIRALLSTKRKIDSNMKIITRTLVASLQQEYSRFRYRR
ncbi:THAP [Nesidiocoris tenuis]|uniref:THAP n=1 Tax=Nesidiocoris tenuis TaxID=355587 RepID=A0ABN7B8T5_9HEMI|nr:THAP [Nesidiocoris tenuis]